MKYEILYDNHILFEGKTLYQIKALRDIVPSNHSFPKIFKGDLGGYVETEKNLSQEGNCWIYKNSKVFGLATVQDDAIAWGHTYIQDNAIVCNNAVIKTSMIYDSSIIKDNAVINCGSAVRNNSSIGGSAKIEASSIFDNAKIFGKTAIIKSIVKDEATLTGDTISIINSQIKGRVNISGYANIINSVIEGSVALGNSVNISGHTTIMTSVVEGNVVFRNSVSVSPCSCISGNITIEGDVIVGEGCIIKGNTHISGFLTLLKETVININKEHLPLGQTYFSNKNHLFYYSNKYEIDDTICDNYFITPLDSPGYLIFSNKNIYLDIPDYIKEGYKLSLTTNFPDEESLFSYLELLLKNEKGYSPLFEGTFLRTFENWGVDHIIDLLSTITLIEILKAPITSTSGIAAIKKNKNKILFLLKKYFFSKIISLFISFLLSHREEEFKKEIAKQNTSFLDSFFEITSLDINNFVITGIQKFFFNNEILTMIKKVCQLSDFWEESMFKYLEKNKDAILLEPFASYQF